MNLLWVSVLFGSEYRDAKQFWKKTVSTPKLELICEIAFNSMKQIFALNNFRAILPLLCSNQGEEQRFLNVLEQKGCEHFSIWQSTRKTTKTHRISKLT